MKKLLIIVAVSVLSILATALVLSDGGLIPFEIGFLNPSQASKEHEQEKVFFDTNGRLYWRFQNNGSAIECSYSTDKKNWVLDDTVKPIGPHFSLVYYSLNKKSYVFVTVESNDGNIFLLRGRIEGPRIAFDNAVNIFAASKGTETYRKPSIAIDDRESLWVSAIKDFGNGELGRYQPFVTNISPWQWGLPENYNIAKQAKYPIGERTNTLEAAVLMTPQKGINLIASHRGTETLVYSNFKGVWSKAYSIGDYSWLGIERGGSVDGDVNVVTVAGNYIYVGGQFENAGGIAHADGIARWDTISNEWSALGSGIQGSGSYSSYTSINAITVSGDDVYVGGDFEGAGGNPEAIGVARWDSRDNSWHALGQWSQKSFGEVQSIAEFEGNLYIGGSFSFTDGSSRADANNIVRWNKASDTWHALASGVNGTVFSLFTFQSELYVGGEFTDVNGIPGADGIAVWDTDKEEWATLGQGVKGTVRTITSNEQQLYVGGSFSEVNGLAKSGCIAQWDLIQKNWKNLGEGFTRCNISTIALSGDDIYIGGEGLRTGEVESSTDWCSYTDSLVRWDSNSSSWKRIRNNPVWKINSILNVGTQIYIAGRNSTKDQNTDVLDSIAVFDSAKETFSALVQRGEVLNDMVRAVGILGNDIYIGGDFQNAGGIESADYIARWNMVDNSWHALGAGVDDIVTEITISDNKVYVGGYFQDAKNLSPSENHINRNHIARWNPQRETWESVGEWIGIVPSQIVVSDDDLYVTGSFANRRHSCIWSFESPIADNHSLLKLNTQNNKWETVLPDQFKGNISAITIVGEELYVGGYFQNAGGLENADNIAQWNPKTNSWKTLDSGTNGSVSYIYLTGKELLVGGQFLSAGNIANTRYLAQWDIEHQKWSGLERDNDQQVWAMEVVDNKLYVNAQFENSKGAKVEGFAVWDIKKKSWTTYADDLNDGFIAAIAVSPSYIFIGGARIELAGSDKVSTFAYAPIASQKTK